MKALILFVLSLNLLHAQEKATVKTESNISYYVEAEQKEADEYRESQCRLDIRHPNGKPGFATLIWFHGGGLTGGERHFPALKDENIAIVTASYRLSPKAELPAFIEDAAAATAWTFENIEKYGGDPKKIFISGHSAGGYLALMVAMDPKWLKPHGISNMDLAGIIPVSAQVTTHFHVKKLLGNENDPLAPTIDEYAPLHFVSKNLPPVCVITGDRKIEYLSRVEENDFFAVTLKNLKHHDIQFHELPGFDHVTVGDAAVPIIEEHINRLSATR